jgi:crossover junction endodeoxyribonuclease RuvC
MNRTAASLCILGIDPGSIRCGWAVIVRSGSRLERVASGVIEAGRDDMAERLLTVYQGLRRAIEEHRPQEVAIESIFHQQNAQSALKLGQARGVAILAAAQNGLPVHEYEPRLVKLQVAGTGAATKEQVRSMVCMQFGLAPTMVLDESDALAVAICHARRPPLPLVRK